MKIYSAVGSKNRHLYVGVVLVGDKDQIYMSSGFKINSQNELSANLFGIKRALSFVKNNKPIYATEDIVVYSTSNQSMETKLQSDEYFKRVLKLNQQIHQNKNDLTEKDNYFLMCAKIELNNTINQPEFKIQKDR